MQVFSKWFSSFLCETSGICSGNNVSACVIQYSQCILNKAALLLFSHDYIMAHPCSQWLQSSRNQLVSVPSPPASALTPYKVTCQTSWISSLMQQVTPQKLGLHLKHSIILLDFFLKSNLLHLLFHHYFCTLLPLEKKICHKFAPLRFLSYIFGRWAGIWLSGAQQLRC